VLTIDTPNTDRSLLTLAELRAAAGVSDNSKDATLIPMGAYVSAMITKACKVASAGIIPPTLRLETVTETFPFRVRDIARLGSLVLARRPLVHVTSVTEAGNDLSSDIYEIDYSAGVIYRKSGFYRIPWICSGDIVVQYSAGYATVPDDLKYAAIKFVQSETVRGSRDPLLKSIQIDGISTRQYWVDPTRDSIVPSEVMDILIRGGYVNMVVA
jgi:hypothetical protein